MNENLRFEKVGPDNWREDIQVKEQQESFVSDLNRTLARAFAYREYRSKAYMIYLNKICIGIAMYYDLDECEAYDFSQFFIDKRYQGHGYGKTACKMILENMRQDGKYKKVVLCYIDKNIAAKRLYSELGFVETGDVDEDEVVMSLKL